MLTGSNALFSLSGCKMFFSLSRLSCHRLLLWTFCTYRQMSSSFVDPRVGSRAAISVSASFGMWSTCVLPKAQYSAVLLEPNTMRVYSGRVRLE